MTGFLGEQTDDWTDRCMDRHMDEYCWVDQIIILPLLVCLALLRIPNFQTQYQETQTPRHVPQPFPRRQVHPGKGQPYMARV